MTPLAVFPMTPLAVFPMTPLAVLLAGALGVLLMPPRARGTGTVTPVSRPETAGGKSRLLLPGVGVVGGLAVVWVVFGGAVGSVVASVAIIVAAGVRVLVLRRRAGARARAAQDVARACGVLAAELQLGRVPSAALAATAEDCPVMTEAAAATAIGGEAAEVWQRQGARPGYGGLRTLARAWQVARNTGAPLGPSLSVVAEALRGDEELDRLVSGEMAASRLTGLVLALLPVVGLGLGYAIGADPVAFLTGTPWGQACLVAGALLTAGGVLWTESLGGAG